MMKLYELFNTCPICRKIKLLCCRDASRKNCRQINRMIKCGSFYHPEKWAEIRKKVLKKDILIISYNTEQAVSVANELGSFNSMQWRNGKYIMSDGARLIPAVWKGTELLINGYMLDQIFIADDSRMNIMRKVKPLLPYLYASLSRSDIPVEYQISIINIDTWNSDFLIRSFVE